MSYCDYWLVVEIESICGAKLHAMIESKDVHDKPTFETLHIGKKIYVNINGQGRRAKVVCASRGKDFITNYYESVRHQHCKYWLLVEIVSNDGLSTFAMVKYKDVDQQPKFETLYPRQEIDVNINGRKTRVLVEFLSRDKHFIVSYYHKYKKDGCPMLPLHE